MRLCLLSWLLVPAFAGRDGKPGRVPMPPNAKALAKFFEERVGMTPSVSTTAEPRAPDADSRSPADSGNRAFTSTTTAGPTPRSLQDVNSTNVTSTNQTTPDDDTTDPPAGTPAATVAPGSCGTCTEFRNGATAADASVCVGPAESWGTPCYPLNTDGSCNADMTLYECGAAATDAPGTAAPTAAAPTSPTPTPTPSPTPAGSTQKLTASLAVTVSPEALSAMMASPDAAVAGLAEGFAEFVGVEKEYVSVEGTDPDLYGNRRFLSSLYVSAGRRAQSSLTVDYAVELPPAVLAANTDLLSTVESQLTAANSDPAALTTLGSNLETSLAAAGIDAPVTVTGVTAEVVVVTAAPTPSPTGAATPSPTPGTAGKGDDDGGGGMLPFIVGGIVIIALIAIGGAYVQKIGPFAEDAPATEEQPRGAAGGIITPAEAPAAPAAAAAAAADPKGVTLELQDPEPADEGPGSPTEVGMLTSPDDGTPTVVAAGPTVDDQPDVRPWWWFGCAPSCDFGKKTDEPAPVVPMETASP